MPTHLPTHCADCDQTFLLTPDGMTQNAACPNCGGKRLERDQPSPTHSDGDLRDMVDPSTGLDQGGNPNQEGIWATTDNGWKSYPKRDESFASVKIAGVIVTPGGTAGIHAGPLSLLSRLPHITINGEPVNYDTMGYHFNKYGNPRNPEFGKPVEVDSYHPAFVDLARKIIEGGHGNGDIYAPDVQAIQKGMAEGLIPKPPPPPVTSSIYVQADATEFVNRKKLRYQLKQAGIDGHKLGWEPGMHGRGLMIGPYLHTWNAYDPNTVMQTNDLGVHHSQYGQALNDNHGIDHNLIDYSSGIEITPEGQVDQLANRDIDAYQAIDPRLTKKENSWGFSSVTFKDKTGKTFVIEETPTLTRNTTFSRTLDMEPHMPWTHEAITKTAGPALALIPEGLAAGAEAIGIGGAAAGAGEAGAAGLMGGGAASSALMKGALFQTGSQGVKGLMGGGNPNDGAGQVPSVPPPPRDPSLLSSVREADLVTPTTNPGYHDSPDGDTHQFADGSHDPNFNNPNLDDSGLMGEDPVRDNAGFGPNSAGLERVKLLAPLLLHYYHSDDSGSNDPLVRELHEQLEAENPGYLDRADDEALQKVLKQMKQPHGVHAKTAAPGVGMPTPLGQPGLQQAVPAPNQQNGQQNTCPYCGGVTTADGSCPQCGAKLNPMGGSIPGGGNPSTPMPYGGHMAASHQGPVTDEQKSAVAELLIQEGRADEVPIMLRQPWDYAKEMAAVAQSANQPPNVDPDDPAPPAPPQEIAPPGATMPMPNPADPSGGNMPVSHVANEEDNYGPSPDAGEVHILPSERSANGKHQVMVIDHHGNSQWPTQYGPGDYGWDNPEAIVTPGHIIDQAHEYAQALDRTRGTRENPVENAQPLSNGSDLIPFHTPGAEVNDPHHPDPWMDNEPGATTFPKEWNSRVAEHMPHTGYPTTQGVCPLCRKGQIDEDDGRCRNCGYTYPYDGHEALDGHHDPEAWAHEVLDVAPVDLGPRHQGHTSADSFTPRCPKCGSGTTGMVSDKGDCHCHACNHNWKEGVQIDNLHSTSKVAYQDEHQLPHTEKNPEAIPAAEHEERHDDAGQQDSSHTWQTDDGQPLQADGEYEMRSPKYEIPDIVKVVAVKPDSITVETIGEYDNNQPAPDGSQPTPLSYQHEITKEEADLDGLTFTPTNGAGDQTLDQYADAPSQAPVNTQAQPAPVQQHSHVEAAEIDDDICPKCASTHITSSMSSETTSFHECFRCGTGWETKEEDFSRQANVDLSWINEDSGPGGDDFFAEMERHKAMRSTGGSRSLSDIASRDDRLQAIKQTLDTNAQARTAGKKFSPREQREFIDENGSARNADKLDLAGTHYEARYLGPKANGDNVREEDLFLGI